MAMGKHFCLMLFLCVTIKAFPTDGNAASQSEAQSVAPKSQEIVSTIKNSQSRSAPSITTTSSLLFKDTKPILTYLLGQPKKQASLSSPAELFSPDRYEFFTFDDDGQIIKKLMSVKEIQKIIANNEKGLTGEHETPIEYYQILTVTPDVESIPAISRINPNEPLFSIHDVIASVQNVLKSEINIKQSQSNSNKTNFVATPSSDHFEILTEKPETPYTVEVQKSTQTSSSPQPETPEPSPSGSSFEANKEFLNSVTTLSSVRLSSSEVSHSAETVESEATTTAQEILEEKEQLTEEKVEPGPQHFETHKEELTQVETFKPEVLTKVELKGPEKLVQSESQKTEESVQLETQKQQVASVESQTPQILVQLESQKPEKIIQIAQKVEETIQSETPKPLPLAVSIGSQNLVTFTEPSTAEQTTLSFIPLSTLISNRDHVSSSHSTASTTESLSSTSTELYESKPLSLIDAHPAIISNETFLEMKPIAVGQEWRIEEPATEVEKVTSSENPSESFVKLATLLKGSVPERNVSDLESSASPSGIPFTPDLANSVSSVLWQIASENSFPENASVSTEQTFSSTTSAPKLPEKIQELEPINNEERTSELPSFTTQFPFQSLVKDEQKKQNPLVVLESILRPHNKPRPFQISAAVEEETSTRGPEEPIHWISSSTLNTEQKAYTPLSTIIVADTQGPTFGVKFDQKNLTTTVETNSKITSTTPPSTFVVSVSPDAVTQSPEQVKPITDKVIPLVNPLNVTNQTEPIIEGIQVIQEGNIGQIPRTTEFPGQIVKEIQKDEEPEFVLFENKNLTNSDSNTYTTHVPYIVTDSTLSSSLEGKEEIAEGSSKIENIQPSTSTTFAPVEKFELFKVTPPQNLDIAFVPMLIKTPSDFKEVESLFEKKEKPQTTEEVTTLKKEQQTTKVEETTLSPENEKLESKILPEDEIELKTILPVIEDDIDRKVATIKNDSRLETDEGEIGTLKQNLPPISYSSKPQKHVYAKPIKTKPSTQVKPNIKDQTKLTENKRPYENHLQSSPSVLELDAAPAENLGLESTVANLDADIKKFSELCNELAFSLWSSVTHNGLSFVRSIVVSPFAVTSLLAMVFLGARGPTSGQMNDVLKLDDMVTFNPHLVFRNVTESLVISRNPGVSTAVFVRELYSDKSKGKLLDFYKERAQQFYDGHVEEINFKTVGEALRRQTNHLVKRQTWGKITDFLRGSNLVPRPPLAAFSANIFQTDCTRASTKDRDGEMYFVILPASRLRRLVPIPAVVWRGDFLAGYEPQLDATAVSISPSNSAVSTIFVLPGQQGLIAPGDTLARLEHHLLGSSYSKGHWSRLMRCLLPRPGLELQIPRMSHKSVINVTASLQKMGLQDLFSADKADLTGLNGLPKDLHLSDMLQVNLFSTCGEETIGSRHHSEIYPATPILRREKSVDGILSGSVDNLFAVSDFEDPAILALPLELRPRQARVPLSKPGAKIPEPPRLRFDRPFLFFVRHNPTGLILHIGRFNPRLMP